MTSYDDLPARYRRYAEKHDMSVDTAMAAYKAAEGYRDYLAEVLAIEVQHAIGDPETLPGVLPSYHQVFYVLRGTGPVVS